MQLTFLGTSASEGYPDAFCACENCERARRLGGSSLRKRCAVLIDDDLLIDLGPDVMAAALMHGLSLAGVRYCLLTHEHSDHLDPGHLHSRSPLCGVTSAPRLHLYATAGALEKAARLLGGRPGASGLLDAGVGERLNLTAHVVEPFQTFAVGPYRVSSVLAAHDPSLVCLLYVVERGGRSLFYCTDTGPLPEATWQALRHEGHRFNVVAMDHTFGLRQRTSGHLNGEQFQEEIAHMRADGLLADDARIYAHHLGHHSNPVHPELVAYAASRGYGVAYDGLVVEV